MMKNCLKKHLARKNNTLVKNSFMVSITCVIEKTGKSFITQHLLFLFSTQIEKYLVWVL